VVGKKHPMLDEVPVVFIIPQGGVEQRARPTCMTTVIGRLPAARWRISRLPRENPPGRRDAALDAGEGGEGGTAQDAGVTPYRRVCPGSSIGSLYEITRRSAPRK